MSDLNKLRGQMDEINAELTALMIKRLRLSEEIALSKREIGKDTYDPGREQKIIDAVRTKSGIYADAVEKAFRLFIEESKARQREVNAFLSSKSIALIGMPGCGKSTVARLLSEYTLMECADCDAEFEKRFGKSPADFILERGEAAFRENESAVLNELCLKPGLIIATGGGAVEKNENLNALKSCLTVYIKRPLELLAQNGRPVTARDGLGKLYARRAPLYEAAADISAANTGTPEACALEIYGYLKKSV